MEYILENKDTGFVEYYYSSTSTLPEGAIAVDNWQGTAGEPFKYYNEEGKRYTESELISKEIVKDKRGVYYSKTDRSVYEIKNLDEEIPEGYTDKKPPNEDYYVFKGTRWIADPVLKSAHLKKLKIDLKNQVTGLRFTKINKGFKFKNKLIQSDTNSQSAINQHLTKVLAGVNVFPLTWRTMDNKSLVIEDKDTFIQLNQVMHEHINKCMTESWECKDAITKSKSIGVVKALFEEYKEK